jgi:hypothetical protein
MTTTLRPISLLAKSIYENPALKRRFDRQILNVAQSDETPEPVLPVVASGGVEPARIHADFNRMLRGASPKFPETAAALANLRRELDRYGFVANREAACVSSKELGVCGIPDATGVIDGYPVIAELKVVRFLPQFARAHELIQLMLYSLARYGKSGEALLIGIYVQPQAPFRTALRFVSNQRSFEPLVRMLAA